jgi:hypothetical protein
MKLAQITYKLEERIKDSATPRDPSVIKWLFCIGLLLVGLSSLSILIFARVYGTTTEADLTLVEGIPDKIEMSFVPRRYGARTDILKFSVAGYRTEYSSDSPKYQRVLNAVQSGKVLRIWVSTKRETIFRRQGWVPLYKMSIGDEPLLNYGDVIAHNAEGERAALIVGSVVLGLGIMGIWLCVRKTRRHLAWGINLPERSIVEPSNGIPCKDEKAGIKRQP